MKSDGYEMKHSFNASLNACSVETLTKFDDHDQKAFVCGLYQLDEEQSIRQGGIQFYNVFVIQ